MTDMNGLTVGVTGTRIGATNDQLDVFRWFTLLAHATHVRHGDCIGVDAQAHRIALDLRPQPAITVHPPLNPAYRAWCEGPGVEVLPEKDYIPRNHDIVDASDILLAMPAGFKEVQRSGTWATIRYAEKVHVPCYVIWPDGRLRRRKDW
jgi:hypothetical protein